MASHFFAEFFDGELISQYVPARACALLWAIFVAAITGNASAKDNPTSLDEAIVLHGGDALDGSLAYSALPETQQDEIIAFLESPIVHVEQTAGH